MTGDPPVLGPLGDLPDAEMRAYLHRVADWVADYRANVGALPIVPRVQPGDVAAATSPTMPASGESVDAILRDLDTVVLPGIVHWGHPAFLGYFGSTSNGPALLGEIVAAALNVSAMTWKTSPAATELESVVLGWIQDLVGLDRRFMGVVYDTASVAIVHALAAARERAGSMVRSHGLAGRGGPVLRVYASNQAHSSVDKAMILLGLGEANVVRIPTDDEFRMDAGALEEAIARDERDGLRPMAVIATVGTTSTASVDPVRAIASVCSARNLWLHVDAAYGGALAALSEGRWVLDGSTLADSIVINPHKWLFVPLDFSVLYVREPEALRAVFALTPEYLEGDSAIARPANGDARFVDYMDYGIQLGRRFRALKAWMAFRAFGREGIASRLREHQRLASTFAGWVNDAPDFQLAAPQRMGIVCFRFVIPGLDDAAADRLNARIAEKVNASGDAYLTYTRLRGRVCLRVGIGNILTTEEHLREVWARVMDAARRSSGSLGDGEEGDAT